MRSGIDSKEHAIHLLVDLMLVRLFFALSHLLYSCNLTRDEPIRQLYPCTKPL